MMIKFMVVLLVGAPSLARVVDYIPTIAARTALFEYGAPSGVRVIPRSSSPARNTSTAVYLWVEYRIHLRANS